MKQFETEILDEESEIEPILEDQLFELDSSDDEIESGKLNKLQKATTTALFIFSFVIFSVSFFPYQTVLRSVLQNYSKMIRVDFSNIELNYFSNHKVYDLTLSTPDKASLQLEKLSASISLWDIISKNVHGDIKIEKPEINFDGFEGSSEFMNVSINMDNIFEKMNQWKGDIVFEGGKMSIYSFPDKFKQLPIPLPITEDDIIVHKYLFKFNMENNSEINLAGTFINTNLFNIKVDGKIGYSSVPNITNLNCKICLTPDENLEKSNKNLHGLYAMTVGNAKKDICFLMKGKPQAINFEMIK